MCEKTFTRRDKLTSHKRIHRSEKPYKCDTCENTFRENGTLVAHIRTHTGEKPYSCDICQKSFAKRSALTHHSNNSCIYFNFIISLKKGGTKKFFFS
jgi:KRAB domain-containing zinc finger protein